MINNNIFQSIKNALSKDSNNSSLGEILKMEAGNTYTVRLLPAKDPKKTFFHYYQHGWTSFANGQYVGALSLQTFGERDPISEERYRLIRTGTDEQKKKAETIKRAEKWLVNVYVVNDPVNPENNGKVKMLRYGKQLHNIIVDAIEGESAEDFGPRVFDLGPNGVNLKVKVEKQGDFPTYVSSKFSMPSEIKDLDEAKMKKVYESVFELDKVFQVRSVDELKQMLAEHFHCVDVKASDADESTPEESFDQALEKTEAQEKKATKTPAKTKPKTVPVDADDDVEKLLADLDVNN